VKTVSMLAERGWDDGSSTRRSLHGQIHRSSPSCVCAPRLLRSGPRSRGLLAGWASGMSPCGGGRARPLHDQRPVHRARYHRRLPRLPRLRTLTHMPEAG
jgi:hypothetical protein